MKVVLDRVRPWRRELVGCLHTCAGTIFDFGGRDPIDALGASWGFYYRRGDVRREEYYFPCEPGRSLVEAIAPYERRTSTWCTPPDGESGWQQVRDRVADGEPVIVAVDNFHLPFRPAYRDVHSNHLLVVYGFDDDRRTVRVLDAVPPGFDGEIEEATLRAARGSENPIRHERDRFFTNQAIAHRFLVLASAGPSEYPAAEQVVAANLAGFARVSDPDTYRGMDGLASFLANAGEALGSGVAAMVDELYVVTGTLIAQTSLHAEWLSLQGSRAGQLDWVELGRQVERLAHHLIALRVTAALALRTQGGLTSLHRRVTAFVADQRRVLANLGEVFGAS